VRDERRLERDDRSSRRSDFGGAHQLEHVRSA
jgi:hypothetical protein